MSEVTYYVALPFIATEDGIAPGEAVQCFNPNAAVMRAEAFSHKPGYVGALAFSRKVIRRRGISGTPGSSASSATFRSI